MITIGIIIIAMLFAWMLRRIARIERQMYDLYENETRRQYND